MFSMIFFKADGLGGDIFWTSYNLHSQLSRVPDVAVKNYRFEYTHRLLRYNNNAYESHIGDPQPGPDQHPQDRQMNF